MAKSEFEELNSFQLRNCLEAMRDKDPLVRKSALISLKSAKDLRVQELLTDSLADPAPDVRLSAAQALHGVVHGYILRLLIAKLRDARWFVREMSALALRGSKNISVQRALLELLSDSIPSVSTCAAQSLNGATDPRILENLVKMVREHSSGACFAAASALIGTNDAVTVERLMRIAEGSAENSAREAAVFALGKCRISSSLFTLVKALKDPAVRVRIRAAEALEGRTDEFVVRALTESLADPNTLVRKQSARALADTRNRAIEGVLLDALRREDNVVVREALVLALEGATLNEVPSEIMRLLHEDKEGSVREAAVRVSASFGLDDIWGVLIAQVLREEDLPVRLAILDVLKAGPKDKIDLPLSKLATQDPDSRIREAALRALSGTKNPWVQQAIVNVLSVEYWRDPEASVRRAAAEALNSLEDCNLALPGLVNGFTSDPSEFVRVACANVLRRSCTKVARDILKQYVDSPDSKIRRLAIEALRDEQIDSATDILIERLEKDPSWELRVLAARSLAGRENQRALLSLRRAFLNENALVRNAAAESLQGVSDQQVLSELLAEAFGQNRKVRYLAALALRGASHQATLRELERALDLEDPQLRAVAVHALYGTKDKSARSSLRKALKDTDVYVRAAARLAIDAQ